jgi:hypothetical protein
MQRDLLLIFSERSTNQRYPSFILEERLVLAVVAVGAVAARQYAT